MKRVLFGLIIAPILAGTNQPAVLDVQIQNIRNPRGLIHACLTREEHHFPDCSQDPAAMKRTIPASADHLRLSGYASGQYALTLIHDENANAKLDTLLGIPKEGFGFSRNPIVRFGAPRFETVRIELGPGYTRAPVRMQYLL